MQTLKIEEGALPEQVLRPITNERMIFNLVDQIEAEVNAASWRPCSAIVGLRV